MRIPTGVSWQNPLAAFEGGKAGGKVGDLLAELLDLMRNDQLLDELTLGKGGLAEDVFAGSDILGDAGGRPDLRVVMDREMARDSGLRPDEAARTDAGAPGHAGLRDDTAVVEYLDVVDNLQE